MASTSVVFPWSTCATMAIFRIGVVIGFEPNEKCCTGALAAASDTQEGSFRSAKRSRILARLPRGREGLQGRFPRGGLYPVFRFGISVFREGGDSEARRRAGSEQ